MKTTAQIAQFLVLNQLQLRTRNLRKEWFASLSPLGSDALIEGQGLTLEDAIANAVALWLHYKAITSRSPSSLPP